MEGLSRPAEVSSFEAASKGRFFDPRINLTVKVTTNKAGHITQFLSEQSKKRRLSRRKELVMSESGSEDSEKVTPVGLDDSHPYAGIYLEEWAGANTRLMYHLRKTDRLTTDEIDFYLAYTARIFDLAEKYVWSSIFNFDYCYREAQAEYRFTLCHLTWSYNYWHLNPACSQARITQGNRRNPIPRPAQASKW